jgi:hypothetical protein
MNKNKAYSSVNFDWKTLYKLKLNIKLNLSMRTKRGSSVRKVFYLKSKFSVPSISQ